MSDFSLSSNSTPRSFTDFSGLMLMLSICICIFIDCNGGLQRHTKTNYMNKVININDEMEQLKLVITQVLVGS